MSKRDFEFSETEIERHINALYELDDMRMDALADEGDPSAFDGQAHDLALYFEALADSLWKSGAFKSREEARKCVAADVDVLQRVGGPGGVVPDDGTLNPDEIAQGLSAIRNVNEFLFQAPICYSTGIDVDYTVDSENVTFRFTSNPLKLLLNRRRPELVHDDDLSYLWIESSIREHRYEVARAKVDDMLLSVMGMMHVLGLLHYRNSMRTANLSMGTINHINTGAYLDMISVRMSRHLVGLISPGAQNQIDTVRTTRDRIDVAFRILGRSISDSSPAASAAKQACRMYLRAYDVWGVGESAMFLAAALEGLLLDKRQKDDLSVRLQDAVAYWLGGARAEREGARRLVSELYKARSNYVHNGEDAPSAFDVDGARELTRCVIERELRTLGSKAISG